MSAAPKEPVKNDPHLTDYINVSYEETDRLVEEFGPMIGSRLALTAAMIYIKNNYGENCARSEVYRLMYFSSPRKFWRNEFIKALAISFAAVFFYKIFGN